MRRGLAMVGMGALMAGAAIAVGAATAGAGPPTPVSIFDDGDPSGAKGYDPFKLVIPKKTTVRWTNDGDLPHTVTKNNGGFDSGTLDPNETFEKFFRKVKTYKYHCNIHPEMRGKVVVTRPL